MLGQVGLVAHRHERGQADAEPAGGLDDRDPEPPALRQEADAAGVAAVRGEGGVQTDLRGGVQDAHAVGPDQAHPGFPAYGHQLSLAPGALGAHLGEAGRDHQQSADPCRRALACHVDDVLGGHRDHGEIHRSGDLA